jgi:uncharacterized membrane protein YciS (DUF1049 family)
MKHILPPIAIGFFFGFMCGLLLMAWDRTQVKEPISYTELERQIDNARCQAEKYEAILAERIRLTGMSNPSPKVP